MKLLLIAADSTATSTAHWAFGSENLYNDLLIVALIVVMLVLLVTALVVQKSLRSILNLTMPTFMQEEEEAKLKTIALRKKRWNKLLGLRPIEDEKDLMIDHEYDGITELDNPIPIWFNALFYSTVCFGLVYLLVYHVFGWGMTQVQEYHHEVAVAEKNKQEYLAQAANLVDESTVVVDAAQAVAGKAVFAANCVACHGTNGEGGIGPNLTDRHWVHGGELKDVFKTVKYGVPEKGMVPWEQTLTPAQIAEVSNYILTLRDTKPANPKAPEGIEVSEYGASAEPSIANKSAK